MSFHSGSDYIQLGPCCACFLKSCIANETTLFIKREMFTNFMSEEPFVHGLLFILPLHQYGGQTISEINCVLVLLCDQNSTLITLNGRLMQMRYFA